MSHRINLGAFFFRDNLDVEINHNHLSVALIVYSYELNSLVGKLQNVSCDKPCLHSQKMNLQRRLQYTIKEGPTTSRRLQKTAKNYYFSSISIGLFGLMQSFISSRCKETSIIKEFAFRLVFQTSACNQLIFE